MSEKLPAKIQLQLPTDYHVELDYGQFIGMLIYEAAQKYGDGQARGTIRFSVEGSPLMDLVLDEDEVGDICVPESTSYLIPLDLLLELHENDLLEAVDDEEDDDYEE